MRSCSVFLIELCRLFSLTEGSISLTSHYFLLLLALYSEILLSSEARVVTYVTKNGERTEHSLEEVLQEGKFSLACLIYHFHAFLCSSGRRDIAKRLKYIKDVMYRLINMNK